jgi:hypothetical protein
MIPDIRGEHESIRGEHESIRGEHESIRGEHEYNRTDVYTSDRYNQMYTTRGRAGPAEPGPFISLQGGNA